MALALAGTASADPKFLYVKSNAANIRAIPSIQSEVLATAAADWRSKSWTSLQVFEIEAARFEDAEGARPTATS